MKLRKIKQLNRLNFESAAPSDYAELYNRTNLKGKGLSLYESIGILKKFKYRHFTAVVPEELSGHHGPQKLSKMNERQKKKFWKKREAEDAAFTLNIPSRRFFDKC